MNILNLKEKRGQIKAQLDGILAAAKTETRALNTEERAKFDALEMEYNEIEKDIQRVERAEQRSATAAVAAMAHGGGVSDNTPEKEAAKSFSLLRAIQLKMEGKQLDGIEMEMHQEAVKEARASSLAINGIGVPSWVKNEKRAALAAGTTTLGGHTVQTDVNGLIPALEPRLKVEELGATVLSGLVGSISIPRNDARGSATWEGEADTSAESGVTFDNITMSPKRLAGHTIFSKQLLYQSSIDIENFVRGDLNRAIRIAVDAAAINGSGSGGQPTGILGISGVNLVEMGTNGAVLTFAKLIEMETEIATDNADVSNMNYLMTPGLRGFLRSLKKDAGSGEMVWNMDTVNGYNAHVSNQVPSTLTKGTASGTCHAVVFGDWSQLLIGQWGPLDLTVDPYTLAGNGQVKVIVNSYWDINARWGQAFSVIKDALLS